MVATGEHASCQQTFRSSCSDLAVAALDAHRPATAMNPAGSAEDQLEFDLKMLIAGMEQMLDL
jgi:hypothetical protein